MAGRHVAVFAVAFGVLVQGFLLRVDRTIMALIDAEAAGEPRREQIRAGFAAACATRSTG